MVWYGGGVHGRGGWCWLSDGHEERTLVRLDVWRKSIVSFWGGGNIARDHHMVFAARAAG